MIIIYRRLWSVAGVVAWCVVVVTVQRAWCVVVTVQEEGWEG